MTETLLVALMLAMAGVACGGLTMDYVIKFLYGFGPASRPNLCVVTTIIGGQIKNCPAALASLGGKAVAITASACLVDPKMKTDKNPGINPLVTFQCNELNLSANAGREILTSTTKDATIIVQDGQTEINEKTVISHNNLAVIRISQTALDEVHRRHLNWAFPPLSVDKIAGPQDVGTSCRFVDLLDTQLTRNLMYKQSNLFPMLWEGTREAKIAERKVCDKKLAISATEHMLCFEFNHPIPLSKFKAVTKAFTAACSVSDCNSFTDPRYDPLRLYFCQERGCQEPPKAKQSKKPEEWVSPKCPWHLAGVGKFTRKKAAIGATLSPSLKANFAELLKKVVTDDKLKIAATAPPVNPAAETPNDSGKIYGQQVGQIARDAINACKGPGEKQLPKNVHEYYCIKAQASILRGVDGALALTNEELAGAYWFNVCVDREFTLRALHFSVKRLNCCYLNYKKPKKEKKDKKDKDHDHHHHHHDHDFDFYPWGPGYGYYPHYYWWGYGNGYGTNGIWTTGDGYGVGGVNWGGTTWTEGFGIPDLSSWIKSVDFSGFGSSLSFDGLFSGMDGIDFGSIFGIFEGITMPDFSGIDLSGLGDILEVVVHGIVGLVGIIGSLAN